MTKAQFTLTAKDMGCPCCSFVTIGVFDTMAELLEAFPGAETNPNFIIEEENDDDE
jgi:hypothetical protein